MASKALGHAAITYATAPLTLCLSLCPSALYRAQVLCRMGPRPRPEVPYLGISLGFLAIWHWPRVVAAGRYWSLLVAAGRCWSLWARSEPKCSVSSLLYRALESSWGLKDAKGSCPASHAPPIWPCWQATASALQSICVLWPPLGYTRHPARRRCSTLMPELMPKCSVPPLKLTVLDPRPWRK